MVDKFRAVPTFNRMVEQQPHLDTTFGALADGTRRSILARLAERELTVNEVADPYDMSLAAVSKHLKVLTRAGLVEQRRDGRVRRCRLAPEPLREASDWIEECRAFWNERFDALAEHLDEITRSTPTEENEECNK